MQVMGRALLPGAGLFEFAAAAAAALAAANLGAMPVLAGASITAPCRLGVCTAAQKLTCTMHPRCGMISALTLGQTKLVCSSVRKFALPPCLCCLSKTWKTRAAGWQFLGTRTQLTRPVCAALYVFTSCAARLETSARAHGKPLL